MDLLTTLPDWAEAPKVSNDCQAWLYGLGAAGIARIFRASLKWFKRAGRDTGNYGD